MEIKYQIRPCPFCGCSDKRLGIRNIKGKGYMVVCGNCGSSGTYIAFKEWHDNKMVACLQAVSAWNRRILG